MPEVLEKAKALIEKQPLLIWLGVGGIGLFIIMRSLKNQGGSAQPAHSSLNDILNSSGYSTASGSFITSGSNPGGYSCQEPSSSPCASGQVWNMQSCRCEVVHGSVSPPGNRILSFLPNGSLGTGGISPSLPPSPRSANCGACRLNHTCFECMSMGECSQGDCDNVCRVCRLHATCAQCRENGACSPSTDCGPGGFTPVDTPVMGGSRSALGRINFPDLQRPVEADWINAQHSMSLNGALS